VSQVRGNSYYLLKLKRQNYSSLTKESEWRGFYTEGNRTKAGTFLPVPLEH